MLQEAGYQTAMIGKWHLGHGGIHDPTGFDYWTVLPGQGEYHDPTFLERRRQRDASARLRTDLITDLALDWLDAPRPGPAVPA